MQKVSYEQRIKRKKNSRNIGKQMIQLVGKDFKITTVSMLHKMNCITGANDQRKATGLLQNQGLYQTTKAKNKKEKKRQIFKMNQLNPSQCVFYIKK